jgi:hypothetical protein
MGDRPDSDLSRMTAELAERWVRHLGEDTTEEDARLEAERDARIAEKIEQLGAAGMLPPRIRRRAAAPEVEVPAAAPDAEASPPEAIEAPAAAEAPRVDSDASLVLWTPPGGDVTVLVFPALAVIAGVVALPMGVDPDAAKLAAASVLAGLGGLLYLPERLLVLKDRVVHLQGAGVVFARRELARAQIQRVLVLKRQLSRNRNWLVAFEVAGRPWWLWIHFSEQGAVGHAEWMASALGVEVVRRDATLDELHVGWL